MANWSNPTLTSLYTDFLSQLKDRDVDIALQFDGTTSSNIPTGAIRWNSTANRWNKWNGSSWAELASTYALTGLSTTGNASIGGALSVTGSTTLGTATATTPATGDNSVNLATTAWVRNQSYTTLSSPGFSGTPTAPTAALSTNTTQLATTAFTLAQIANDAPTKSGTGATGTWGINISGNAATATSATNATNATNATVSTYLNSAQSSTDKANITTRTDSGFWQAASGTTANGWPVTTNNWWHLLCSTHSNGANYYSLQLAAPFYTQNLYFRATNANGNQTWSEVFTSTNYNTYVPTLNGTGAGGTWGISISGNAATASSASASTAAAVTNDNSTSSAIYPALVGGTTGNQAVKTSSAGLSYVPSTGTLSATAYLGNGTGLSNLSTFSQTAGTGGDLPVGSFGSYFYVDVVATGTKTVAWFSCTINHTVAIANDFIMGARIYDLTAGGTQVGASDTGNSTANFAQAFNAAPAVPVTTTTIVGRTYRYQLLLYKSQANGPTLPSNGRIIGLFL